MGFYFRSTWKDAKKLGVVGLGNVLVLKKLILPGKLNRTMKARSARLLKVSSKGILWILALTLAEASC